MNHFNKSLAALDLNLITALDALIEHQSVSDAAMAVGRTQSAMSHSLARLRDHFGDPILVRDGWSMKLTSFGHTLKPRVTIAAQSARAMFETNAHFDPATTTRRIRIAMPDLCVPMFAPVVSEIAKEAPNTTVEFTNNEQTQQSVLRSEADVGLSFGRVKSDTELIVHELSPLEWCTYAPLDHEYALTPSLSAWCNARHILVGQGRAGLGPIDSTLKRKNIERQVFCIVQNFSIALSFASKTNGLFTTLKRPLQAEAQQLGLQACALPFDMPDAPISLLFRADYGDQFQIWLKKICIRELSAG